MSSVPATYWANPWYRVLRCLVVLLVARLEWRIARLLAAMDALPMDARYDAEFARLDARCALLEDVRDAYRAWLDDPRAPMPRAYAAHEVLPGRRRVVTRPRLVGARAGFAGVPAVGARGRTALTRGPPGGGRCTITSLVILDRPAGLAGAGMARAG